MATKVVASKSYALVAKAASGVKHNTDKSVKAGGKGVAGDAKDHKHAKVKRVVGYSTTNKALAQSLRPILAAVSKNQQARKSLQSEIDKAKSVYFDVKDSKDVTVPAGSSAAREMKLLDDELSLLRASARSMFKPNQVFHLTVWYAWVLNIAVTTGLVEGVQSVDPSGQAEWIAAASLFDEYKVDSLHVKYRVKQAVNYASGIFPIYIIGYDPTNNANFTSVLNGCQVEQHQLGLMPSTYEAIAATTQNQSEFHVTMPKGIQDIAVSGQSTGSWCPTVTPLSYGFLKFYGIGDNITAQTGGGAGAIIACNCVFRIRE